MQDYSIDVVYAWAQLGVDTGAQLPEIADTLEHARAYKYSTRQRIQEVERFVEFFTARDQLGDTETSFVFIRRAYHKKAMMLHPDRNLNNKAAEEQLKLINNAFALIDAIHREARDYYRQSEEARRAIEKEARETREREMPPSLKEAKKKPHKETHDTENREEKPHAHAAHGFHVRKYVAASVPRFIRTARLSHVPVSCVIGSWHVMQENDVNYIYDIIMLPEREFLRARMHLSTPTVASPALQRGGFSPSYIPKDMKSVVVPSDEPHPERYAKEHFLREFGAEGKGN